MASNSFFQLPSVNDLLEQSQLKPLINRVSRTTIVAQAKALLDELRGEGSSDQGASSTVSSRDAAAGRDPASRLGIPSLSELAERIARRVLAHQASGPRPAINATGAILHSCLGDPPLAESAWHAMVAAVRDYALLLGGDPQAGSTASAIETAERLLCDVTGAEAALVVNNQAAAWTLACQALVPAGTVVLARSEVTELTEGLRLLDVTGTTQTSVCEVGTANVTRLGDYRRVLAAPSLGSEQQTDHPILVARMATAGVQIVGRTQHPSLAELVELSREFARPLVHDVGLGPLIWWAHGEGSLLDLPSAVGSLKAGADLVIIQGHGLLGGPRCCMVLGRRSSVGLLRSHPLRCTMDVTPATAAALAATLELYGDTQAARQTVPVLQLLSTSVENLRNRADRLAPQLAESRFVRDAHPLRAETSLTGYEVDSERMPSWVVALTPDGLTPEQLADRLLRGTPPVVGRIDQGRLVFDLRSVLPSQDSDLAAALIALDPEAQTASQLSAGSRASSAEPPGERPPQAESENPGTSSKTEQATSLDGDDAQPRP